MGSQGPASAAMTVPIISMRDPVARRPTIIRELMQAATEIGFFHITDSPIPSEEIDGMFKLTKARNCGQADSTLTQQLTLLEEKLKMPVDAHTYLGYERNSEIGPRTGLPDHKESLQVAYDQRGWGTDWPTEACVPGFRKQTLAFMHKCHDLCLFILECFAEGLGLPLSSFSKLLDRNAADCNSALRTMHYYDVQGQTFPEDHMRLSPHTDITAVTLLFHTVGETGLEVCPGRKATTDYAHGDEWTPCDPVKDAITVNIGDVLMYVSDDVLKSNWHRIRAPNPGDYQGARNTVVYFTNPNLNAICQGPRKKYPAITGEQMAHVMDLVEHDKAAQQTLAQGRVPIAASA